MGFIVFFFLLTKNTQSLCNSPNKINTQNVIRDCRMCAVLFPGLYFHQTSRFISNISMFGTLGVTENNNKQKGLWLPALNRK